MTVYFVSSATTSVGISMGPDDQMTVSGVSAIAVDTTDSGATAQIMSGGVMSRTTLEDGAMLFINSAASAVSGTADLTSEVAVESGGSLSSFTVSGFLELNHGGLAEQIVIGRGGIELVNAASVSGRVAAGGVEEIFLNGIDESGAVAGVQRIFQGEASGDTILAGGLQEVNASGIAAGDQVDSRGSVVVSRFGEYIDATVESGGTVTLGGFGFGDSIAGAVTVLIGGLDFDNLVQSGGRVTVSSGGKSQVDAIGAGGTLTVLAGGLASRTDVSGSEVVGRGGQDLSATIESGGLQLVSGGKAGSGTVESGGRLQLTAGGVASDAVLSSGAKLTVSGGGLAALPDLLSGASAVILSGGAASGGTLGSGASETISKGGQDQDDTVLGLLLVRGSATRDQQVSGGQMFVLSGGVSVSALTNFGGEDLISAGGTARATRVAGDASEVVFGGGLTSGSTIFGDGQEIVTSDGVATQLTVLSGGTVNIAAGGRVTGLGLASGATLIDSGRVLLGDRVLKGAISGAGAVVEFASNGLLVLSTNGAGFDGRTVISGGRIELALSGAIGTSQVVFSGGAVDSQTLQLDGLAAPAAGTTFANTISNFNAANKAIDLRALAFSSGAAATLSGGVLTLVDGGKRYKFHLAGSVGKSFSVAADGSGGTQITAHATAAFTQAAAVLPGPSLALQSPVSGYGGESPSPFHTVTAGGRA